jgi:hypothetical protein
MKDTMQGNQAAENITRRGGLRTQHKTIRQWWWWVGVTEKCNNQIEARTAVVGTVGVMMDGGEARAKGKTSGWQTMQGDRAVEDAMGGEG